MEFHVWNGIPLGILVWSGIARVEWIKFQAWTVNRLCMWDATTVRVVE